MPLAAPRTGVIPVVGSWPLSFSCWPVRQAAGGFYGQPIVFASDPWAIISGAIKRDCPQAGQPAANAFLKQAEDNFRTAASASIVGAKPVLLYYSFLNLAKAYILTTGQQTDLDRVSHGIRDRLTPGGSEPGDTYLAASPTVQNSLMIFDEFYRAVAGAGLATSMNYKLPHLLPQVVTGHRLWCAASQEPERFVSIERVFIVSDVTTTRTAWLTMDLVSEDVTRLGLTIPTLLTKARLQTEWQEVTHPDSERRRLQLIKTATFINEPAEAVSGLIGRLCPYIWTTVISTPPYRKYYLYAPNKVEDILPQLLAMYAVMFYLGSVTRYRPHRFLSILDCPAGPQIHEVIATVPAQFLYLMASRFAKQEIAQAAVI